MGKKGSLSAVQRAEIVIRNEVHSECDISNKPNVGKTAVHNSIIKFQNDGSLCRKKKKWSTMENG